MEELQSLRTMITTFRVADLQSLMTCVGMPRNGKKLELQARAIELLTNASPGFNKQLYYTKIKEYYKMVQDEIKRNPNVSTQKLPRNEATQQDNVVTRPTAPPTYQRTNSYPPYQQVPQQQIQPRMMYTPQQPQQLVQPNIPNQLPMRKVFSKNLAFHQLNNIRFSELPYFRLLEEIMKPTSLVCTGAPLSCKGTTVFDCTFSFTLSCNAANKISNNRDISKIPPSYPIQVLLRFCTYDKAGEYDDCLPTGLTVKLNGGPVALPPGISNSKTILDLKRSPMPIGLYQTLKISPLVQNEVKINWVPDQDKKFAFSVSLVQCYKPQDLLEKLKKTAVIPIQQTKLMISKRLVANGLDEDVVATTNLKVSIMCPLGRSRLVYAARGRNCTHLQCFDALTFISLNEKRTTWLCPVCNTPLPYRDIFLDQYSMDMLASSEISSSNCEHVQLLIDGSWKCYDEETENSSDVKNKETLVDSVEIILDDEEEGEDNSASSSARTNTNNEDNSNRPNSAFVDLTDEDETIKQENEAVAANAANEKNHFSMLVEEFWRDLNSPTFNQAVSSSGYISPRSVISIDSPSPPVQG